MERPAHRRVGRGGRWKHHRAVSPPSRPLRRWRRTRRLAVIVEQRAATKVLRRLRPSVVWCNTVLTACYVKPACRFGVPVILLSHESATDASRVLERYDLTGRDVRRRSQVTLAGCSPVAATGLAAALDVDPASVRVLSSPVDVAAVAALRGRRRHSDEPIRVVACGRATVGKGVDTFIAMAERLCREEPRGWEFVWIGQVDPETWASDVVEFTGETDSPSTTMSTADVFVHTARTDQFPLVVLEAMALALPVVAFDVGDVRTQVGETGIIVEAADLEAMIGAVRQLATDSELRTSLGDAGLDPSRASGTSARSPPRSEI